MNKLKEQKKIILEDFDFKKVENIMRLLNWQWQREDNKKFTPSIADLIEVATHCLDELIKNNEQDDVVSIGGFEAIKVKDLLELRFIIEKSNSLSSLLG